MNHEPKKPKRNRLIGLTAMFTCWNVTHAGACAVCYGEPDHPMTQGAEWAMVTMLGITYTVLLGILAVFVRFFIRSKNNT